MEKICAVYKIVNTVTGDFYVGSSKDVKKRWGEHKRPSKWKEHPNSQMYQDMQKYGLDKFRFQILCPVMPECLMQVEQECIEMLKPTYNDRNAKGWDVERHKKTKKEYNQSEKGKEAQKKYQQSDKRKKCLKKYQQSEKGKETSKRYSHQLCSYKGETLTLDSLRHRFQIMEIPHPTLEAKKYLIK